jgi:hypothetical protein
MLERILPPGFEPAQLPEPESAGARLTLHYCVQCHNLPNPAMHQAEKWPKVVKRMVDRMRGHGNMGRLMADLMAGVEAPDDAEVARLLAYLQRYAQTPLDPKVVPEAFLPEGEPFRLACKQCHVLPDPQRYTAAQWPAVVARMERNMVWMNRVVGSKPVPGEPQLRIDGVDFEILGHCNHSTTRLGLWAKGVKMRPRLESTRNHAVTVRLPPADRIFRRLSVV